eukprot:snap_masked-scaffold_2-processed-gene-15.21-mRNA-1 protein AED:1.00 eAED:1.00 QI:0/-1/0/0/-1/1/1/0/127
MESESNDDLVNGLKALGLNKAENIMADGSKALEAVAEAVGASHVLSKKHFLPPFSSAAPDLKGNKRMKYTSKLRDVLTESLTKKRGFNQFIENMLADFQDETQYQSLKNKKKENVLGDDRRVSHLFR